MVKGEFEFNADSPTCHQDTLIHVHLLPTVLVTLKAKYDMHAGGGYQRGLQSGAPVV